MTFFTVGVVGANNHLLACSECAAVIVDDDEGANRCQHEAFHSRVEHHRHVLGNHSRLTGQPE